MNPNDLRNIGNIVKNYLKDFNINFEKLKVNGKIIPGIDRSTFTLGNGGLCNNYSLEDIFNINTNCLKLIRSDINDNEITKEVDFSPLYEGLNEIAIGFRVHGICGNDWAWSYCEIFWVE